MSIDTIQPIPTTTQPQHTARRIAASALGVRLCDRCRPMVCSACRTLSQTHAESEWCGGHGWRTFDRCHEVESCISRGGRRA